MPAAAGFEPYENTPGAGRSGRHKLREHGARHALGWEMGRADPGVTVDDMLEVSGMRTQAYEK